MIEISPEHAGTVIRALSRMASFYEEGCGNFKQAYEFAERGRGNMEKKIEELAKKVELIRQKLDEKAGTDSEIVAAVRALV